MMKKILFSAKYFWIKFIIGFSILLLCFIFSLAYLNTQTAEKTFKEVQNSFWVLESLEETMVRISMIESGTRGYLLFGEPRYLETYFDGEEYLSKHLNKLDTFMSGDKELDKQLTHLSQLIFERIRYYRYIIDIRNKRGFEEAQKIKKSSNSHQKMIEIRNLIERLQLKYHDYLEKSIFIEEKKLEFINLIILSGGAFAICLLFGCFIILTNSLREKEISEQNLQLAYENASHLAEFIQDMNTYLEPKKCFEALMVAYPKFFKNTYTSLYSVDEQEAFHLIADHCQNGNKLEPDQLPLIFVNTMREVIHTGHLIHIDKLSDKKSENAKNYNNLICIPLNIGDKIIGVLNIMHFQSNLISDMVLSHLKQAVAHLALAVRNSLLFKQVQALSIQDELTGLYNRRYFYQQLEQECARSERYKQPLTLIMLDIDYFKQINDQWGHQIGDQILKHLSERLLTLIRKTDLLSRIGGEEFSLLLPNTTLEQAHILAERMREEISQTDLYDKISVTLSIGLAQWQPKEPLDNLIKRTDEGLYKAKKTGRNRVVSL